MSKRKASKAPTHATRQLTATSWEYRGITIDLNAAGRFLASMPGRQLRTPSILRMKQVIDEALEVAFKPFDGLIEITSYRSADADPASIVDEFKTDYFGRVVLVRRKIVAPAEHKSGFIDETDRHHYAVIVDQPGAAEAWRAHWEAKARKAERVAQLDAEINDAHKAIPYADKDGSARS